MLTLIAALAPAAVPPSLTSGARRATSITTQLGRELLLHVLDVIQPGIPCERRQCSNRACGNAVTKLTAAQLEPFTHPAPDKVPVPICGLNGCTGELHRVLDLTPPPLDRWEAC